MSLSQCPNLSEVFGLTMNDNEMVIGWILTWLSQIMSPGRWPQPRARPQSQIIIVFVGQVENPKGSVFSLLKIPGCIVVYCVIVGCGMSLSFLDPTFSPWMLKTVSLTRPRLSSITRPVEHRVIFLLFQNILQVSEVHVHQWWLMFWESFRNANN